MLKRIYICVVTNILHFFNYNKIEDAKGINHVILNSIDFILMLAYASISIWKLSTVSKLVLIMNFITLSRLIVGNIKGSLNLRDKYEKKYLKRPGLLFKPAYDIKLIIELCLVAFLLIPFWIQGMLLEEAVIQIFATMVIILGFGENLINVFVQLFNASIDI